MKQAMLSPKPMRMKTSVRLSLPAQAGRFARVMTGMRIVTLDGRPWHRLGAPVTTGETLFEIADPASLHAQLVIPEDEIGQVVLDTPGQLATAAHPGRYLDFSVQRISPIAEPQGLSNVFMVRAQLDEIPDDLRPGMQGVAKLELGQKHYAWIWTRKLRNWVRMFFWV